MIQQKCNKVTGLCDPNGFLKLISLLVLHRSHTMGHLYFMLIINDTRDFRVLKLIFCPENTKCSLTKVLLSEKSIFAKKGPKGSKMTQNGPKWPIYLLLIIWDLFWQKLIFRSKHFGQGALCVFGAKNQFQDSEILDIIENEPERQMFYSIGPRTSSEINFKNPLRSHKPVTLLQFCWIIL